MTCNSPLESWTFPIEYKNSPFDKSNESIELKWIIFQWTLFDSIGQPSFCYDVIVLELILQCMSVFNPPQPSQALLWLTTGIFQSRFHWPWRPHKSRTCCSALVWASLSSSCFLFSCVSSTPITSLALPVEIRIASCPRRDGMSGSDSGVLDGSDSSSCITSSKTGSTSNNFSKSAIRRRVASILRFFLSIRKQFDLEGEVKRKNRT